MIMYNGEAVWPDNDGVPDLFSCGVGLGRIFRFAGQTKKCYPVLAHIIVCAELTVPEHRIHAFLHDMPEVCHSDVPTPWKTNAAKKSETRLLRRFYKHHNIKWPNAVAQAAVHHVDAVCLAAEANVIGHAAAKEIWPDYDETAARLTRRQLKVWEQFLNPAWSGPLFETMFNQYLEEHKNATLIAA